MLWTTVSKLKIQNASFHSVLVYYVMNIDENSIDLKYHTLKSMISVRTSELLCLLLKNVHL